MVSQQTSGSILLISSVASRHIFFPLYQSAYAVSKAGVLQLTTALAAEWAQYGIRVNSISPGFMRTTMTSSEGGKPAVQSWLGRTPLGRSGEPVELTGAVVYLCSDAGRYVTGTDLYVDGIYFFLVFGGYRLLSYFPFRWSPYILVNRAVRLLFWLLEAGYDHLQLQQRQIIRLLNVQDFGHCPGSFFLFVSFFAVENLPVIVGFFPP
jgi:hypothetical protein